MKSHPQKNTLLQSAKGNAEAKACKRVFFSTTQERIFSSPIFFNFFSPTARWHCIIRTDTPSNINRFGQLPLDLKRPRFGQTEARTTNSTYKKLTVQWLNEAFVIGK